LAQIATSPRTFVTHNCTTEALLPNLANAFGLSQNISLPKVRKFLSR
jgi:hypothetical protein